MRINWKKWSVIGGSAVVATGLFALSPVIPFAGFLMVPVVIGGSVWSTIIEIKEETKTEEEKKKEKKEKEERKKQEKQTILEKTKAEEEQQIEQPKHYPYVTLAEGFEMLQGKAKDVSSPLLRETFDDIYQLSLFLSENETYMGEEDHRFLTNTCYFHLESLLTTYQQLEESSQKKEEQDMLKVMTTLKEKMTTIKERIVQEKEMQFQKSKRILQEKLKRY